MCTGIRITRSIADQARTIRIPVHMISDRAGDCLANPPCRVGREFVAAAVFEFFNRFHEAHVTFLN